MGSQLGFPTANIKLDYDLYLPKFGVYGIACKIDKKLYEEIIKSKRKYLKIIIIILILTFLK